MTDSTSPRPERVRFAPSPTGYLHVGSARAALFNFLHARHTGGKFLLRIEDTDLERSTDDAVRQILESMKWMGLEADEPAVYQTKRVDLHARRLEELLAAGKAYRDYCPKDRLDQLRDEARAAGTIFSYREPMFPAEEALAAQEAGAPFVIRFRTPPGEVTAFNDLVYGRIETANDAIGDFVIARGDGSPLYNFTNVVDDVDMGITLVCRGEDHVSNTPKQVLLYQAFGVQPPRFAHLPLILGTDKQKLSKRHGATGVDQFASLGILPEALLNFLALLGWAPSEAEFDEVMTMEELTKRFSLDRVNKSPAVFDHEKLMWMNGMHIRRLSAEELVARVLPVLAERFPGEHVSGNALVQGDAMLRGVIDLAKERCRTLIEFGDALDFFFAAPTAWDDKAMRKLLAAPEAVERLRETGRIIAATWEGAVAKSGIAGQPESAERLEAWCHTMEEPLRAFSESAAVKFGAIAQPVRLAVTGRTASPPLFHGLWFLGAEEVARRIEACAAAAEKLE